MSNNSRALTWAGQTLIILYFIIAILVGYSGHKDLAADMYFHGIVILIGVMGWFLASIGGAIGDTSTIIKTICVLSSVFSFFVIVYFINALIHF
jgi:hypothetical protein